MSSWPRLPRPGKPHIYLRDGRWAYSTSSNVHWNDLAHTWCFQERV